MYLFNKSHVNHKSVSPKKISHENNRHKLAAICSNNFDYTTSNNNKVNSNNHHNNILNYPFEIKTS